MLLIIGIVGLFIVTMEIFLVASPKYTTFLLGIIFILFILTAFIPTSLPTRVYEIVDSNDIITEIGSLKTNIITISSDRELTSFPITSIDEIRYSSDEVNTVEVEHYDFKSLMFGTKMFSRRNNRHILKVCLVEKD